MDRLSDQHILAKIIESNGKDVKITYRDGKVFQVKIADVRTENGLTYTVDKQIDRQIIGGDIVKFEIVD
jgi:hypothetical protein